MAGVLGNVTLGNEHQQFKPNPASMPFPYWLGVNFTPNHVVVAQIPYYLIQSMPNAQAISPNVGRNGLHELITKAK